MIEMTNKEIDAIFSEVVRKTIDKIVKTPTYEPGLEDILAGKEFAEDMGVAMASLIAEFGSQDLNDPEVATEFTELYSGIISLPLVWFDRKIKKTNPEGSISDIIADALVRISINTRKLRMRKKNKLYVQSKCSDCRNQVYDERFRCLVCTLKDVPAIKFGCDANGKRYTYCCGFARKD